MQPLEIIRAAIKAVPAVKYALGVAGIFAVVALISSFGLHPLLGAGGAVVIMVLMVALVIFAKLTSIAPKHFLKPALVMTWAFLLITVAAAVLLCSSIFFGKPLDVRALVTKVEQTNAMSQVQAATSLSAEGSRLLDAARFEMQSGAYSAAWKLLDSLPQPDAALPMVIAFRAELAELWLRNISVRVDKGETFSSIVQAVTPSLVAASKSTNSEIASTALAHLGYGNFLRWSESREELKIVENYKAALDLDPRNPYAHMFWGHWILTQNDGVAEATEHFQTALQTSNPEIRIIVRQFQFAALTWSSSEKMDLPLLQTLNEMRALGESLPAESRHRYENRLYYPRPVEFIAAAENTVPKKDHFATYQWLVKDLPMEARRQFVSAHLNEKAGNFAAALELYNQVKSDSGFDHFAYANPTLEGIERCEKLVIK